MAKKIKLPSNEIIQALLSYRRVFRTIGAFSMLINLLMLVPSLYMLQVYDRVLPSRNGVTLAMLSLIMMGMYGMISALEYVRSFIVIRIGAKLDMHLNKRVYTAAFETNLKQQGVNAGQSLNDLTTIRQFVTGNALFAFFDAPWFPIYLIVIFMFNVWLGVFSRSASALLVVLAIVNERVSRRPLAEATTLSIRSTSLATSNLRNAEVIEAMGMLPDLMARWSRAQLGLSLPAGRRERESGAGGQRHQILPPDAAVARAGTWRSAGHRRESFSRHDDRRLDPDGPGVEPARNRDFRVASMERREERIRASR